jgi:hypothetical protein
MTANPRTILCRLLVAATVALPLAHRADAQQRRPLPQVDVVGVGGSPVALGSHATGSQWLILYVGASTSSASSRILEAMAKWELGGGLSRILVIVAQEGDPQQVSEPWREKLPDVRWVGDPKNEVARALDVRGGPTLIGVKGEQVEWVLAGVLNDPAMLRDVVRSWISPK